MGSRKLGKFSRIIAAEYILVIGIFILINQFIELAAPQKSGDSITDLLKLPTLIISTIMAFVWSSLWIYAAYILFRNKRDNFLTILILIILSSLGVVGLGYIIAQYQAPSQIVYNPLPMLIFYLLPAFLIFISLKNEPGNKESSVESARRILGEHVRHLSDEELHKSLK